MSAGFLRSLPKPDLDRLIAGLTRREAHFLLYFWPLWARKDQLPPPGDWTTWMILGGRGSGKTRAGAEWVRWLARRPPPADGPWRIALVGETYWQAREVMVEGVSGLLSVCPSAERPLWQPSRRRLLWPGGTVASLFSAEEPDGLRGPQFHFAWCDELAKWRYGQETWDMLQFGLRLGKRPRQMVTTTPRPTALIKGLTEQAGCMTVRVTTDANRAHLSPIFLDTVVRRYQGTRLGRQELNGEILEDKPGALWVRAMFERTRLTSCPPLARIVIAVDPPAGSGPASECGIIAAGVDDRGCGFVLEDCSLAGASPMVWARRVRRACEEHKADRIVAEANQGGDMVQAVLRQAAPEAPVRLVQARRGKRLRAEPVASLYEQDRVHHVGVFPRLEDQLCAFDGASAQGRSPDRMDALVWALTDLIIRPAHTPQVRPL